MRKRTKSLRKLLLACAILGALMLITWLGGGWLKIRAAVAVLRNEPSVVVADHLRYDFGVVSRGERLQTTFPISNHGGRRLILYREDGDCSCSTSDSELRLPPGKVGSLTAELDTGTLEGLIQTQIKYRTNDPHSPLLVFTMLAEVTPGQ